MQEEYLHLSLQLPVEPPGSGALDINQLLAASLEVRCCGCGSTASGCCAVLPSCPLRHQAEHASATVRLGHEHSIAAENRIMLLAVRQHL